MQIVLYGFEPFLADQKLKEIIGNYRRTQKSGLSLHIFDADNFDFDDFKQALETVSMFEEKKLIVLKNFFLEDADSAGKILELAKKADAEESKDIVIVFFEAGAPVKNKEFDKLLKKPNLFQEFKKLEGARLNAWIQKEFEKLEAKIESRAISILTQSVGSDLYRLKNEIDKLAAYKKLITEKDVVEMVTPDFHSDIFAVIDAIAKKDKKLALKILNEHIENGESEIYLLTMIIYQFRNLLRVKSLIEGGVSPDNIAKKIGLHPFVVKKSIIASRLFSFEELKNIYQKLFDIDLKIKIGEMEPQMALNLFVVEL
ncbi:DNA polymerase III subunit delta [Candidatus Azambacteria bacterium RIFCSPLOWO2_01_FULL_37_9]|uniref:DNA polymerase III subunit delta n=1 Tax=Candidatus Azambacteria bacterium RIFCSPLOWO2_01_FULL_37_9 TaxID=1797297 RepID=A0A1F5C6Q3_9BACT|nr:MAG: DNA polymerase III subunit delta [Candidatus Azambacteria bacterium RIFCSPLOWO2_01_FULL_37_9]